MCHSPATLPRFCEAGTRCRQAPQLVCLSFHRRPSCALKRTPRSCTRHAGAAPHSALGALVASSRPKPRVCTDLSTKEAVSTAVSACPLSPPGTHCPAELRWLFARAPEARRDCRLRGARAAGAAAKRASLAAGAAAAAFRSGRPACGERVHHQRAAAHAALQAGLREASSRRGGLRSGPLAAFATLVGWCAATQQAHERSRLRPTSPPPPLCRGARRRGCCWQ